MERYICIHGHFYQPPRENPWLEAIELQDSAYPYHDWNERITAECYAPNSASRILDGEGRIVKIVNNYARISFNFGPTLLSWLEEKFPETYQAILAADQASQRNFSGHGSALAQAYNHMIMPLANRRDKYTQVRWGIHDFEQRFRRAPEGMWLPETAVDLETLDILAELGIRFTVLAPHQASRVRKIGGRSWRDVSGARVDPSRAYELRLASGRKMNLFFYDGPVSRAVAFEGLLNHGEDLANRLTTAFSDTREWAQLGHIATDGESYGHHHHRGDMALAYALDYIESNDLARLTNYGEFLEQHPPTHQVEIVENSSWSCVHGIERWRSNCGCNSGGYTDWNQEWRAPLREALDWLRDMLASPFEEKGRELLRDPWAARDDYLSIVLDRSPENLAKFFSQHAAHPLSEAEQTIALRLLELQRHAMLMYTSCGWFFDELSGIETVQVIQYAGRALQLAHQVFGGDVEPEFLERLERAKSNIPDHRDGRRVYEKFVRPAMVDLAKVGAHYAVSSVFESYPQRGRVYCYAADREDLQVTETGKAKLVVGRARIMSEITRESSDLSFGVLHFGDQNLNGGVQEFRTEKDYAEMVSAMTDAFKRADYASVIRSMDKHFGESTYSLKSLFRDEQRRILNVILDATLSEAAGVYRQLYDHHATLVHFLNDLNAPLPKAFQTAAEFTLNAELRQALKDQAPDADHVGGLLEQAKAWGVELDAPGLGYALEQTIEQLADRWRAQPDDLALLQNLKAQVALAQTLPFTVDFWWAQNVYYAMLQNQYPEFVHRTEQGDEDAQTWVDHFVSLGAKLRVHVIEVNPMPNGIKSNPDVATLAQEIVARRRIPIATYRLQFNRHFTFRDALAIVPYLHDLGISDVYASPIFKARANSTHGYDICDHSQLNPDLGSEDDWAQFCAALQTRGMGLILDMVPNHMGIGDVCNTWWMDVLENGPSSIYAPYFDIDWVPSKPELKDKVLLPILEDQYGRVLESGKFRLVYADGAFFVYHHETKLPVAPRTYSHILEDRVEPLKEQLGEENEHLQELQSILTALSYLPPRAELDPEKISERNREKEIIKRRIAALYQVSPQVHAAIDSAVEELNGTVGEPRSFDKLDRLLDDQAYRPAFWRVAAEEINYRRFFDINDLAAIRVEVPEVFEATHALVLRLLTSGQVTGLRIDHADGLWDPANYLRQLQKAYVIHLVQARVGQQAAQDTLAIAVATWFDAQYGVPSPSTMPALPLYVVVEKILSEKEPLPRDWAAYGTTGYDFLGMVNQLFVDRRNQDALSHVYADFIGGAKDFRNLVNSTKKMIMLVSLASEIYVLSHHLERVSEMNRWYRDFTLDTLTFALREIIACLRVYRTYITEPGSISPRDQTYIEMAVAEAKRRNPRTAEEIFDFVRDTLLLRNLQNFREEDQPALINWVMKFQQITGPVMAKGVEDTAFYVFNRLTSLNEVGGDPGHFGLSVADFHRQNAERAQLWRYSMLSTATHDTKRGEDVRARINVLSEIPNEWQAALGRWSEMNSDKKSAVDDEAAPDRNDEYLFYQTLLGVLPYGNLTPEVLGDVTERVVAYMRKATKEAKVHTSWVNPNNEYDDAVEKFARQVLVHGAGNPFLDDLLALQRRIAFFGQFNSLSQVLLKLTSPGVPDTYQGTDLWDLSLVDPDNRRQVDYAARHTILNDLKQSAEGDLASLARQLVESSMDGQIKLYLIERTLNFRRAHAQLFSDGDYAELQSRGAKPDHVCAFVRTLGDETVVVAVPHLVVGLTGGAEQPPLGDGVWQDTWLALPYEQAGRTYRNMFSGETLVVSERDGAVGLAVAAIFSAFPVALLERIG